jgi:alpha-L-fucosidase
VKEFVDACRKHDIVPFFYYATYEFRNPDFRGDFDKYLAYLRSQVEILCTQYGKIGGLWFDGNWSRKDVDWQEDALYGLIRKHQPEAMIINNTGLDARGATGHPEIDAVTYERGQAAPMNREGWPKYVTGEMCDTVCSHWGIADDLDYKSPRYLIESLCNCRRVGANYLMNIGPDARGNLPMDGEFFVRCMGRWMEHYGEAVYNGRPYWTREGQRNFVLRSVDGESVYFFVYGLNNRGSKHVVSQLGGAGDVVFDGFGETVEDIRWMDNDETLAYTQEGDKLTVNFTAFPYGTHYCVRVAKGRIVSEHESHPDAFRDETEGLHESSGTSL